MINSFAEEIRKRTPKDRAYEREVEDKCDYCYQKVFCTITDTDVFLCRDHAQELIHNLQKFLESN